MYWLTLVLLWMFPPVLTWWLCPLPTYTEQPWIYRVHIHTYELVNIVCSLTAMLALLFLRFLTLAILLEPVLLWVFLVIHWRRGLVSKRLHLVRLLSIDSSWLRITGVPGTRRNHTTSRVCWCPCLLPYIGSCTACFCIWLHPSGECWCLIVTVLFVDSTVVHLLLHLWCLLPIPCNVMYPTLCECKPPLLNINCVRNCSGLKSQLAWNV